MMPEPYYERLAKILEESGLEGALLLVYRDPENKATNYSLAINGMREQQAIGYMMTAIGNMLNERPPQSDIGKSGGPIQPPNIDGITGPGSA